MQATSSATTHTAPSTSIQVWSGRVLSALGILFLLFDGVIKVAQATPAVDSGTLLGYTANQTLAVGILELALLAIYALPRTATLGAVLMTGYLGGAMASQFRIDAPVFNIIFPLFIAAFLWGGLLLRDARLRAYITNR
ncbi:MAG: DoxX family protein [Chloroflexia bacterium]